MFLMLERAQNPGSRKGRAGSIPAPGTTGLLDSIVELMRWHRYFPITTRFHQVFKT